MKKKSAKSMLWSPDGIEERPNQRRSAKEGGGGPECGTKLWNANSCGRALIGIEKYSLHGEALKRGRVGKLCRIQYRGTSGI